MARAAPARRHLRPRARRRGGGRQSPEPGCRDGPEGGGGAGGAVSARRLAATRTGRERACCPRSISKSRRSSRRGGGSWTPTGSTCGADSWRRGARDRRESGVPLGHLVAQTALAWGARAATVAMVTLGRGVLLSLGAESVQYFRSRATPSWVTSCSTASAPCSACSSPWPSRGTTALPTPCAVGAEELLERRLRYQRRVSWNDVTRTQVQPVSLQTR